MPSIHICIHASMHLCIYASTHAYLQACMPPCIHVSTHPCIHACMDPCVHPSMHPCMHPSIHPCINPCIHACMHACLQLRLLGCGVKLWKSLPGVWENDLAVEIATAVHTDLTIDVCNGNDLSRQQKQHEPWWLVETSRHPCSALRNTLKHAVCTHCSCECLAPR